MCLLSVMNFNVRVCTSDNACWVDGLVVGIGMGWLVIDNDCME